MSAKEYRICKRCIMDTSDLDIEFNENGFCNHCRVYDKIAVKHLHTGEDGERKLNQIVEEIKRIGKNNTYDCIIGLSGGVDSSYVAYLANKLGLRPLAVHVDNGWNTKVAATNIERIVDKCNWDLQKYDVDWDVFRDLQLAFLKASVPGVEVPTDNIYNTAIHEIAGKRNIKYYLKGSNVTTESIIPHSWVVSKIDTKNIKAIHRRFGTRNLKGYPMIGPFKYKIYYAYVKKIRRVAMLNYVSYIRKDAIAVLEQEFGWQCYGAKHDESVYTRFVHGYILPFKFNIDTRKAYLSNLICSGQITRDNALKEIQGDFYTPEQLQEEKDYILSKLGLSEKEFEGIMNLPVKAQWDYPSYKRIRTFMNKVFTLLGIREGRQSSAYS